MEIKYLEKKLEIKYLEKKKVLGGKDRKTSHPFRYLGIIVLLNGNIFSYF